MFDLNYDSYDGELIDDVQVYDPRKSGSKIVLPLNFTIDDLDTFCLYVNNFSSEYVTHSALVNAKTMFELIDTKNYLNNDSLKGRLEYISLVLEARVDLNLTTKGLIKQHVLRNCNSNLKEIIEEEIIKGLAGQKISDYTCKYINTIVFENLIDGYSLVYSQKLMNILDKKDVGGYKRIGDFSNDLKNLVKEMDSEIKKSEEFTREGKGFDLSLSTMKHKIHTVSKTLNAPSNKLKTGLQYLNKMLNGGLESGRSYLFMGVPGVGKSIVLLSIALWIRKYNKLPKINDMKQAVLFISQENSESETFERLFNMSVSGIDIREFSEADIERQMIDSGVIMDDNDKDGINFIFRYFNDKEIGVSDIDDMIESFAKEGIQIIAVVQDYIEKLQPKHKFTEIRLSLGSIAIEMSELAKRRNIPFVSAAQLNRMASSVVDNAVINNKTNTTRLLGRQNVSESWDLIKNTDCCIIINREIDYTSDPEKEYLGFKLDKYRGKPNKDKLYVFLHPFSESNGILLTPDVDLDKPLSRVKMEDFNPLANNTLVSMGKPTFNDDNDDTSNEFIESIKDIITDDYTDSVENYVDVYKNAEVIEEEMKRKEKEKQEYIDLKTQLKDIKKLNENNGRVVISKFFQYTDDGRIIIHASSKQKQQK